MTPQQMKARPFKIVRSRLFLAVVLGLFVSGPAMAQSKAPKIGVVNVEQITRRSRSIQNAVKQAEEQVRPQQDRADAKLREMQKIRQNLSDRRSVLKQDEIDAQETRVRALREEVDDLQYEVNKKIDRIQAEVMEPEIKRIKTAVEDVARSEGYDVVLRSESVLYRSDAVDLTPLVIQALDRPNGASVGADKTTGSVKTRSSNGGKTRSAAKE
jgi:outer membrane protein